MNAISENQQPEYPHRRPHLAAASRPPAPAPATIAITTTIATITTTIATITTTHTIRASAQRRTTPGRRRVLVCNYIVAITIIYVATIIVHTQDCSQSSNIQHQKYALTSEYVDPLVCDVV